MHMYIGTVFLALNTTGKNIETACPNVHIQYTKSTLSRITQHFHHAQVQGTTILHEGINL